MLIRPIREVNEKPFFSHFGPKFGHYALPNMPFRMQEALGGLKSNNDEEAWMNPQAKQGAVAWLAMDRKIGWQAASQPGKTQNKGSKTGHDIGNVVNCSGPVHDGRTALISLFYQYRTCPAFARVPILLALLLRLSGGYGRPGFVSRRSQRAPLMYYFLVVESALSKAN
jgi:hypothetical protein